MFNLLFAVTPGKTPVSNLVTRERRMSTPQRCRGALSRSRALIMRVRKMINSMSEQHDTRMRAALYSIHGHKLAMVERDVVNLNKFIQTSLHELTQEVDQLEESVELASRDSKRMHRTMDQLFSDM